ncbi:MAG: tetratricopeptide repeat protein [Sumerlaeia bacterium]
MIQTRFYLISTFILAAFLTGCSEKTPSEKLDQVMVHLQNNETSRALTTLIEITKNNPEDPAAIEARLILARVYASQGNAPKALETLENLYEERSFNDEAGQLAFEGIVQINAQLRDFESAIDVIDGVLAQDDLTTSTALELNIRRVNLMFAISDNDAKTTEGINILNTMIETASDSGERGAARETLANYYRMIGDYEASNQVYDDYLKLFPNDPIRIQLFFAQAVNDFNAGKQEEALATAKKLEAEFVQEIESEESADKKFNQYKILAQNYLALGELDKTEEYMIAAMGSKPMSVEALRTQFDIANIFIRQSMNEADKVLFQRGIDVFEKIISDNANSNIAFTAEEQITQANQAFGMRQQQIQAQTQVNQTNQLDSSNAEVESTPEETAP